MSDRPLYGLRYKPSDVVEDIVRELPYVSYWKAIHYYKMLLKEPQVKPDLAFAGANDRFFLTTCILRRPDAFHPWLYDRCREVEANPDDMLDLWARYHYKDHNQELQTLTTKGWKRHGDLRPGDYVFGADGEPTRVVATRSFTDSACMKVTFDNGINFVCGAGHLWTVEVPTRERIPMAYNQPGPKRKARKTITVETAELARMKGLYRPVVRVTAALQMPAADLPVDPYVLGAWLGDGSSRQGAICGIDAQIFEEIERRGHRLRAPRAIGKGRHVDFQYRTVEGLTAALRQAGVLNNKHIPQAYMMASAEQRLALLQGLIDTDGSASPDNGCITLAQTDKAMAEQVRTLANSLGFKARLTPVRAGTGSWHVVFQASREQRPCLLARKLAALPPRPRRLGSQGWRVHSVEPAETVPTNCIQVEADDGLYLVGRELIPTHNSTFITFAGIIQEIIRDPEITCCIFSLTNDIARPFLSQIKEEIEGNEDLQSYYPDVFWQGKIDAQKNAPKWSVEGGIIVKRKGNPKEATVEAYGLLDALPTGKHFQLRVYNDVITERVTTQTDTEQTRKATTRWELSQNLGTKSGGRMWHEGTRYHFGDTYGDLLQREILQPRIYAATHNGQLTGKPVFLTPDEWETVKIRQSSTVAAQMLQNPLAGARNTFRIEHLRPFAVRPRLLNVYILGDPSKGKTRKSDRTSLAVVGVDPNKNRFLLDGFCHRMRLSERYDNLKMLHEKWEKMPGVQHVRIGYERYGMQTDDEYFEEKQIEDNVAWDYMEVNWTREGQQSKDDRVERLEPYFKNSQFFVPPKVWVPNHGDCFWVVEEGQQKPTWIPMGEPPPLLRQERDCLGRGENWRIMKPVVRLDEERHPYDFVRMFMEEYILHPFSPHDDLIDSVSRIEDVDPQAPVSPQSLEELFPDAFVD